MNEFLVLFFLLISAFSHAQEIKRTHNWYFGYGAGISFNSVPPSPLTNGVMGAVEGCAAISDTSGNLLFYTNGVNVWNKNHQYMQNGTGLMGDESSTQSSLIVPQPGNDSLYYIFTTDAVASWKGLQANLVNINAQGGLGEVIVKNVVLATPVCEKLTATRHQNGRDIWVMTHGFTNNIYQAYLVTDKGLVMCPVTTAIGEVIGRDYGFGISGTDAIGCMKFSIDGKKLANGIANPFNPNLDVLDFNTATGTLSNLTHLQFKNTPDAAYGVEFSPSRRYLYFAGMLNYFYRIDLSLGNADSMLAHRDILFVPPVDSFFHSRVRCPQLAPNKQIYIALVDSFHLASVQYPDSVNCGFKLNGFNLGGKISQYGLTNFVTTYFLKTRIEFSYVRNCRSDTVRFYGRDTLNRNNWNWQFKKLADGSTSTSSVQNPVHRFSDTGTYEVRMVAGTDTIIKTLHIGPAMQVALNLGSDTVLCNADSILLDAGNGYYCYQWQDFSSANTYMAKQSGTYTVTVTDKDFCQVQESVKVTFGHVGKPSISRKADTLFTSTGSYTYQWFKDGNPLNGDTLYFTVRKTDGSYRVQITNPFGCKAFSDMYTTTGTNTLTQLPFRIYPNPATDLLYIEPLMGSEQLNQVVLRNCIGQTVHSQAFSANNLREQISCKGFTKGLYLLELTTTQQTYTVRILIR